MYAVYRPTSAELKYIWILSERYITLICLDDDKQSKIIRETCNMRGKRGKYDLWNCGYATGMLDDTQRIGNAGFRPNHNWYWTVNTHTHYRFRVSCFLNCKRFLIIPSHSDISLLQNSQIIYSSHQNDYRIITVERGGQFYEQVRDDKWEEKCCWNRNRIYYLEWSTYWTLFVLICCFRFIVMVLYTTSCTQLIQLISFRPNPCRDKNALCRIHCCDEIIN